MARTRSRRRTRYRSGSARQARNWLYAIAVLGITIAIIGGFAYLKWGVANRQPALANDTLCPIGGPWSVTVVLLDGTDAFPDITKLEIRKYLTDVAGTLPKYGLLELRVLEPAIAGGRVMFSKCNPGDGSNLSELVANPRRAYQRWLENFQNPLQQALEGTLEPEAADISPIMETLQRIAVERFSGRERKDIPKSLIIVSDMLENAPGYSQYQGDLSYNHFRKTVAYKKLRTDLHGAKVFILYVQRLTTKPIDSGNHIRFWLDWVRDNEGVPGEAIKLQGAG